MSVIATAVRHLLAAGVTGDALIEAIAEMEDDIRAEPKPQSKGAARTARWRAKKAEEERHETSHVTHGDGCDAAPLSPSPKEINSNPHPHTPEHTPRARKADDFPCPEWADPQVWRDLKANRRTKRLSNTTTAHRNFVNAVEAMADDDWPPDRLLEAIVAKGWGGAHDPRDDRKPGNDQRIAKSTGTATAAQRARENLGCH